MSCSFMLFHKGTNVPVESLQAVDDALRVHFEQPPSTTDYCSWYGCIGFLIAIGKGNLGTPELREAILQWHFPKDEEPFPKAEERFEAMILQLDYLESLYSSDGWTTIGKL